MKISLTIQTDNDAFDGEHACVEEVQRILEHCAEEFMSGGFRYYVSDTYWLRDRNGNRVGEFIVDVNG